jgi:hypothetical protein
MINADQANAKSKATIQQSKFKSIEGKIPLKTITEEKETEATSNKNITNDSNDDDMSDTSSEEGMKTQSSKQGSTSNKKVDQMGETIHIKPEAGMKKSWLITQRIFCLKQCQI